MQRLRFEYLGTAALLLCRRRRPTNFMRSHHTPRVLSLQSHAVYGFVGNKSATFPLQCLGFDVCAINTITLSNRPGYPGGFRGKELEEHDLVELIEGLSDNNLCNFDVVINGYIKSMSIINGLKLALDTVKKANPNALFVCDPVLGDHGRFYVPSDLLEGYKKLIIPHCTLITPNSFETEMLTGVKVRNLESAREACRRLHALGAEYCLLKGVDVHNSADRLSMIMSSKKDKSVFCVDVARLDGQFHGCGDLCTGLAAGWLYRCQGDIPTILEKISATMSAIMALTASRQSSELLIIEGRDIYISPPALTAPAYAVHGALSGIIFDMDGTLTEPGAIDFNAMYDRIGIKKKPGVDILTQITQDLTPDKYDEAHEIIIDEEMKGCDAMKIQPDFHDMLKYMLDNNIKAAISTRNCGASYHRFRELAGFHSDSFGPVLSRESLDGCNKPDPMVAKHILEVWGVSDKPHEVWFVGDSLDDMRCGKGAGCRTCLLSPTGEYDAQKFGDLVDICVPSLTDFVDHVKFHEIKLC